MDIKQNVKMSMRLAPHLFLLFSKDMRSSFEAYFCHSINITADETLCLFSTKFDTMNETLRNISPSGDNNNIVTDSVHIKLSSKGASVSIYTVSVVFV